ncbi:reverse transcriptase domain-containing protein [Tanacetum coccineum]
MDQNNLNDFDPTDTYDHYDAIFQPDYDRYIRDYESHQHYVGLYEQEAGGSSDGLKRRRTYIYRERKEAEQMLIDDYFGDDEYELKYPEEKFRRRVPGANNDLNVLYGSLLFNDEIADIAPECLFVVNGHTYRKGYYLANGIYPTWSTFVKMFSVARDEKTLKFKRVQEAARKDIERAFRVLQDEGFEVNLRDVFVNPAPNIVRDWVKRCDLHVRKIKELRDRKTHIDLRQDLMEHL